MPALPGPAASDGLIGAPSTALPASAGAAGGIESVLNAVSAFIWGPWFLIPLLLGTGMVLTVRLRGLQLRKLGPALRFALLDRQDGERDTAEGDISHYQALTTALAATVGVGNIIGVATAIHLGGPGALLWMWVTALFGMASKYAEAFLAVRFRTTDAHGRQSGGPQYYLRHAIKGRAGRLLSVLFAVAAILASFGIGSTTQSNAVAAQLSHSFGWDPALVGILLAIAVGAVLLGGISAIGTVTAAFVPMMIVFYVTGCLYILAVNAGSIPHALGMVLQGAFTGSGAAGGFLGSTVLMAVQYGVARGIFSNESGMGSAAIAAAAAKTRHPTRQGLVSMTQTFIDTIIVVTCTGLVILTTGSWTGGNPDTMTAEAFSNGLPGQWGHYIVSVALVFLASSTILGWAYYAERCVVRLVGVHGVLPFRLVFTMAVFIGSVTSLDAVWAFADIANGLMAVPNLIGLLVLSGLIVRETGDYLAQDPHLRRPGGEFTSVPTPAAQEP
nr:sodium:alanine symporter family protein [Actinomyces bowdenii]